MSAKGFALISAFNCASGRNLFDNAATFWGSEL